MLAPSRGPLRDATSENCRCFNPWYINTRQIQEGLGVPFLADHIRALTLCIDSRLADAGKPLVRQLARHVTEGWPKSSDAQAEGFDGQ